MGRGARYTTDEERKKAQDDRNKQLKLNNEKNKEKQNKDREYRRRKREEENLLKHSDSLIHSIDSIIQEQHRERLNEVDTRSVSNLESDEARETYAFPDENISDSDIYGEQDGFADNSEDSSPDI
jgi:septal ring factor EnvC (AmiA/AmiB activator)